METIEFINREAYKKIGIGNFEKRDFAFSDFVIDINFTTERLLCIIAPDIFSFELKNASKILWGEDMRQSIPWSEEDIPPITTLRFLFEKATGLYSTFFREIYRRCTSRK